MIRKIVKSTWTDKAGNAGYCYKVYYPRKETWRSDRVVTYTHKQDLPLTVTNFVLNANNCNTVYVPKEDAPGFRSLKRETYSN